MSPRINFSAIARTSAVAVAAVLLQPLAQAQSPGKPASAMPGMAASSSMGTGGMDMKSMMKDMNEKMSSMPMSGNQDMDFAMMMRVHHQGAIDMAQAELRSGKEPKMRKMAKEIVAAQKKEIAEIDQFLASHGHPMGKMSK